MVQFECDFIRTKLTVDIYQTGQMQGKIFAIALIVLGVYILSSVLSGKEHKDERRKSAELFHIGCYDIDRPLSHSQDLRQHISQLAQQFNRTSAAKVVTLGSRIQSSVYSVEGGNELAKSFEKYIASYQNIKSRNQYQQSYFNTLKQTKDQFTECREKFGQKPWNCRNVSRDYNQTEEQFNKLKGTLQLLMTKRAQHLNKTEDLLKDEDVSKDAEYTEKYTKEIDILNGMIAKKHQKIKINNETLIKLTNDLYKIEVELNSTKRILEECTKNKAEIDFCKNISDYVSGLYDDVNLHEIERSMKQKRHIIDLLKSHLIQSKKLGEDISIIEEELEEAKRELEEEETLYHETNNSGKCGFDLQFKCSHDNVIQLQTNVTIFNLEIIRLLEEKENMTVKLNKDLYELNQFSSKIELLNEELKNSAIDIEHLKLKEEKKKRQLQQYRSQLNEIIFNIGDASKKFAEVRVKRQDEIQKIDILMQRGEELIECLSKKELYQKLQAKRPETTKEDELLKQQASRSLTEVIKELLNQ